MSKEGPQKLSGFETNSKLRASMNLTESGDFFEQWYFNYHVIII